MWPVFMARCRIRKNLELQAIGLMNNCGTWPTKKYGHWSDVSWAVLKSSQSFYRNHNVTRSPKELRRAVVEFIPWRKLPACESLGKVKLEAYPTGAGWRTAVLGSLPQSQAFDQHDCRRPDQDDKNPREDEQHQGEDHLHRCLLSLFFRPLATFDSHAVGLHSQRLRDG